MSDYPIGTVATATVRGVEGVRVMRVDAGLSESFWRSSTMVQGGVVHDEHQVTDIRPLVVLDVPNPKAAVHALQAAWECVYSHGPALARIAAEVREQASPRPPKPPEPQGLGAVVESTPMSVNEDGDTTTILVRHDDGLWWSKGDGGWHWADVRAVRVLSEGVTP